MTGEDGSSRKVEKETTWSEGYILSGTAKKGRKAGSPRNAYLKEKL